MNIFTDPDDYVMSQVSTFLSYSSPSFEESKLKVFNQLFNVIGNAIRDQEELIEELTYRDFDRDRAIRTVSGESIFYGYTKVRTFGKSEFVIGDGNSITVLDNDRPNHPEIIHWMEMSRHEWNPYPNFKKEYSIVWNSDFKDLGPKWCEAAVWFYSKCKEWFETNESKFHYAFPKFDERKTQKLIDDVSSFRTTKYTSDEEFSKAYGLEYRGDMVDFLTRRWEKEKARIMEYIDETIAEFSNVTSK